MSKFLNVIKIIGIILLLTLVVGGSVILINHFTKEEEPTVDVELIELDEYNVVF